MEVTAGVGATATSQLVCRGAAMFSARIAQMLENLFWSHHRERPRASERVGGEAPHRDRGRAYALSSSGAMDEDLVAAAVGRGKAAAADAG